LPLVGTDAEEIEDEAQDIKERIAGLNVPEHRKEAVRHLIADDILDGVRPPYEPITPPPSTKKSKPGPPKGVPEQRADPGAMDEPSWEYNPVHRVRQLTAGYTNKVKAALIVEKDLKKKTREKAPDIVEPDYAMRDAEIRDSMWQLIDKIEKFAKDHFDFDFGKNTPGNKAALDRVFAEMKPEVDNFIGRIASGGPGGEDGWKDLFYNKMKRRALVCAIIGNLLTEQVFEHLFFGGSPEDEAHLEKLQRNFSDHDGTSSNSKPPITPNITNTHRLRPQPLLRRFRRAQTGSRHTHH
jgi:hypothetical protein